MEGWVEDMTLGLEDMLLITGQVHFGYAEIHARGCVQLFAIKI
jgi:hypothetical protein